MASGTCDEFEAVLDGKAAGAQAKLDDIRAIPAHIAEECIAQGLSHSYQSGDAKRFNKYVFAAVAHQSTKMTPVLCEVIVKRPPGIGIENVVEILEEIADPTSVPALAETLKWEPDWDEFHHVARKCIWALSRIGTDEALEVVQSATSDKRAVVSEWATSTVNNWKPRKS